jgi:hypothetical protein
MIITTFNKIPNITSNGVQFKIQSRKHASAASTNNNKGRNSFFLEIFKNMIEIKASANTMLACPLMDIIYLIHLGI